MSVDCLLEAVVDVGGRPENFNLLGNGGGGTVGSNCGILGIGGLVKGRNNGDKSGNCLQLSVGHFCTDCPISFVVQGIPKHL